MNLLQTKCLIESNYFSIKYWLSIKKKSNLTVVIIRLPYDISQQTEWINITSAENLPCSNTEQAVNKINPSHLVHF